MNRVENQADILEVIGDLSSDEVFTSPKLANGVLDMLPEAIWSDPGKTFLDPGAKTGVFLREITRRLMTGLSSRIPDEGKRLEHILKKQVWGLAITELTSLMARRSVYCSKEASGPHSIVKMDTPEGHIWFESVEHDFSNGKCKECKASADSEKEGRENHAYAFIHQDGVRKYQQEFPVKFDVIVGNPPYQLDTQQESKQAIPIYHKFVETAMALGPEHIALIIPSRWMAGGMGLDSFRKRMLSDRQVRKLVDYQNAADVFPSVGIIGGVCYFLWSAGTSGPCEVTTIRSSTERETSTRFLDTFDVMIREQISEQILQKVQSKREETLEQIVSGMRPFGLASTFRGSTEKSAKHPVSVFQRGGIGYASPDSIAANNKALLESWKVFIARAGSGREREKAGQDMVIFQAFVGAPGTACTETYIACGPLANESEASSVRSYLSTRFVRFLISLRKISQDATRSVYSFVPQQEWDRTWTDADLFSKYELTDMEIDHVVSRIREMNL